MRCAACPVPPDRPCYATALPALCEWAASGDPVKMAHVVNRSRIAEGQPPVPAPPLPEPPRPDWRYFMSVRTRAKRCPHHRPGPTDCGSVSCAMDPTGTGWIDVQRDCAPCLYLPDEAP